MEQTQLGTKLSFVPSDQGSNSVMFMRMWVLRSTSLLFQFYFSKMEKEEVWQLPGFSAEAPGPNGGLYFPKATRMYPRPEGDKSSQAMTGLSVRPICSDLTIPLVNNVPSNVFMWTRWPDYITTRRLGTKEEDWYWNKNLKHASGKIIARQKHYSRLRPEGSFSGTSVTSWVGCHSTGARRAVWTAWLSSLIRVRDIRSLAKHSQWRQNPLRQG